MQSESKQPSLADARIFDGMPSQQSPDWNNVAKFLRQQSHDVCNDLNGLDLEAVLLAEFMTDAEGTESIARMRIQIRRLATVLRGVAAKFADPTPIRENYRAKELLLIWQEQLATINSAPAVSWREDVGSSEINVDAASIAEVFRELLENAQAFGSAGPLSIMGKAGSDEIIFELHEPKSADLDPAGWGKQPFAKVRRGHYGLGLWDSQRKVEASGGKIARHFALDPKELVTTLTFPIAPPKAH